MKVRAPRPEDLDDVLALIRAADEAVWRDSDWIEPDLRELRDATRLQERAGMRVPWEAVVYRKQVDVARA